MEGLIDLLNVASDVIRLVMMFVATCMMIYMVVRMIRDETAKVSDGFLYMALIVALYT